jgi:hypothetical protein
MSMSFEFNMIEAGQELTRFDFIAIEKTFGKPLKAMDNFEAPYAIYWRSACKVETTSYDDVASMSLRAVNAAFKPVTAAFRAELESGADRDGSVLRSDEDPA